MGGPSRQPMDHHGIAMLVHALHQREYPTVTHAHFLGRFPLAHASILGSFQPIQIISFLLAHRDSFHPSALRLSRGTFYLAQLGTSHLAATPQKLMLKNLRGSDKLPPVWASGRKGVTMRRI